jgi:hypothetical protein
MNPFPCVRLRGLPYSAQKEEIADFLDVTPIDIVILEKGGRPSGQALVLCATPEDMDRAIDKDKKDLGSRYIEVFQAIRSVRSPVTCALLLALQHANADLQRSRMQSVCGSVHAAMCCIQQPCVSSTSLSA